MTDDLTMAESSDPTPAASYDREAAVRAILDADDSLMGRVYRFERDGKTPQEIADAEGNQGPAFVYNYRLQINSIISGDVPESAWAARSVAAKLRRWLKTLDLSPQLRVDLQKFEAMVRLRAEDPEAEAEEVTKAVENTEKAERVGQPGIYVYTLPHYLKHPVDEETGRTLLKVGHSAKDAHYRAESAKRLTALPEDPILLRIYPAQESAAREKEFHAWLRDADHAAGRTRRGGSEWFVTSTKFLDRVAKSMDLSIEIINDVEGDQA
jgi:hypothetical protein